MTGKTTKPLRLAAVHLENWRNFTLVDVALQQRVFLVGANAAGKSNLLDAFRFLHDLVTVGGGFQEAVGKRGGVSKLRSLAARRYPDVVIQVKIGSDEEPATWTYEVRFAQDNRQRPFIKREWVAQGATTIIERPDEKDKTDPERLTQTYLEQVNANQEFRAVSDFFSTIRYLHIVPQLVREPDRSVGRTNDPYGGDFLEQIARTTERTQKARLRRISDALKIAGPQLAELTLWRDEIKGTPHLRGKYEHWRPQGAWQTEEQFSDGTLRLIGLLWAVLDGTGPLLLEEPELSLHPEVVRFLPQMFARIQGRTGRQILISTHSTDLLRDDGIGLDEVALLRPGAEGTTVSVARDRDEVKVLLESGLSMADAVIPLTRPDRAEQLTLFGS
jgi:predicted ATPase